MLVLLNKEFGLEWTVADTLFNHIKHKKYFFLSFLVKKILKTVLKILTINWKFDCYFCYYTIEYGLELGKKVEFLSAEEIK